MVQAWGQRFINLRSEPFYWGQPLWAIVKDIHTELDSRSTTELWLDELMLPNKVEDQR